MAYELLTGKRPFEQEGARRHCAAVLAADFERVGDLALDAFFSRALAPHQHQRFLNLDVFLTAWRAVLPTQASPREVTDWLAPHSRCAAA